MEEHEQKIPILKIDQVVQVLSDLNIKATANDIKKPQTEKVVQIYKEFLAHSVALNAMDSLDTVQTDLVLHFDEDLVKSEMDSFKLLKFYSIFLYWFDLCGLDGLDISFWKMFHPTKNEFLKTASAMVAFCKFLFSEFSEFQMVHKRTIDFMNKCTQVRKETDDLQMKLFSVSSEVNQLKPLVDKCRSRSEMLKEKITNLKANRHKVKEEFSDLSKEEHLLETESKEILSKQQNILKKFSLYEKLIIKSPERLIKDSEKHDIRMSELDKLIVEIMKEIDAEKCNIFEREKFIENSDSISEILTNLCDTLVQNANTKSKEIEAITEETTNLNFELEELVSVNDALQVDLDKVKDRIKKFKKETELKFIESQEKDDKLLSKININMREVEELNEKKVNIVQMRDQMNQEFKQHTDQGFDTIEYYRNLQVYTKQKEDESLEMIACIKQDVKKEFNLIETKIKQLVEKF